MKEVDGGGKPAGLHRTMVSEGNGPCQELEGEQEGRRKIVRKEGTGRRGSKTGAETNIATTLSVAEETTVSSVGDNWACSNGGSGMDKCSGGEGSGARGWGFSKKDLAR